MRGGGAEGVMVTLANTWVALGLAVDLVLVERVGPNLEKIDARVCIIDLGARRVSAAVLPLVRYLRTRQPDVMLAVMAHANICAIVARAVAISKTRLVVSERIDPARSRNRTLRLLRRWLYPHAERIIAVSHGAADGLRQLLRRGHERIEVVYNPLDLAEVARAATAPPPHPWLAMGREGNPVVVAAGRLTPQKGFDLLLRAFASIAASTPARLIILGEGPERHALMAQARDLGIAARVALPGFVANPYDYFSHAALFVLASRFEGLPNALLQALACGTPVVSSNCPSGPAEILEGGKWGALVPVGDANALAAAMLAALRSKCHPDGRHRATDFDAQPQARAYLRALGVTVPAQQAREA